MHSIQIDLKKEYIKQFLLSFSPSDFSKLVHESITDKIKTVPTSSVIGTQDKYLHAPNSTATFVYLKKIYIPFATLRPIQSSPIFITSDLYLRANKSFVRGLSKTGFLQLTTEMVKELRKELNNNEIDLTKLYNFKNKSGRTQGLEFKKDDFILPNASPWINRVLLNDIHAPNDLKIIFELKELF